MISWERCGTLTPIIVIQSYNEVCVSVCLFTCCYGLLTLQTKPSSDHADRGYKGAAVREEGQLAVQDETELVKRHSDDTLDKKEDTTNKEMIDINHLLNLEPIKLKLEIPSLHNSN